MYIFSHRKKRHPVISDNMNKPWGHYVTWNKPESERQKLYNFTFMWTLNCQTHRTREWHWWLPMLTGGKLGKCCSKGTFFSYKMNKFWETKSQCCDSLYSIVYLKLARRRDLSVFTTAKTIDNNMKLWML